MDKRRILPTVALVGLVLLPTVLVGCGGSGVRSVPPASWANKAELKWMRGYGRWSHRVEAALANFEDERAAVFRTFGSEGMPGLRRAAAALEAACAHEAPATPPTARLQPALHAAHSGCRLYTSVARAVQTTNTAIVYGVTSNALVDRLRQADHQLQTALISASLGTDSLTAEAATQSSSHSHIDTPLGRVASRLAGHALRVRCWSAADWRRVDTEYAALSGRAVSPSDEGWTPVSGSTIDVLAQVCGQLETLRNDPHEHATEGAATAAAVRVLAHEAQHAAGVSDEAIAECYALQTVSEAARDLGASSADAAELARKAWAYYRDEPPGYHTTDCRNGGRLDLRSGDAVWP